MERIGWRLTLEPVGATLAWSLVRVDDRHPAGLVWSGLAEAARPMAAVRESVPAVSSAHEPWGLPLADPGREPGLAVELGQALLPEPLRAGLVGSGQHTVTVAVRGWPAIAPWPAIAVDDEGTRLVERARLVGGLPAGMVSRLPAPADGPSSAPLWVVDPGPIHMGQHPPLYPDGHPPDVVAAAEAAGARLVPAGPVTRERLGELLAERPSRWLHLGHISHGSVTSPAADALVLHRRSLSARDWLAEPGCWPAPVRVALLGCGGDDMVDREATGLVAAALAAGARLIVTTRWLLPADRPGADGTTRLALDVDTALAAADPVDALGALMRARLERWRRCGDLDAAPLLWASLLAYDEVPR